MHKTRVVELHNRAVHGRNHEEKRKEVQRRIVEKTGQQVSYVTREPLLYRAVDRH